MADPKSCINFLVDTGADISALPKSMVSHAKIPTAFLLFAANGTNIPTYGTKLLTLDLNLRRQFTWNFVIADVKEPIIGVDFLTHFHLLVDPKNNCLIDAVTKLTSRGKYCKMFTAPLKVSDRKSVV